MTASAFGDYQNFQPPSEKLGPMLFLMHRGKSSTARATVKDIQLNMFDPRLVVSLETIVVSTCPTQSGNIYPLVL